MTRQIPLTRGLVALVDDEDYEEVAKHKWYAEVRPHSKAIYARRFFAEEGRRRSVKMHQVIAGKGSDHVNRNGLDNRRSNLRPASASQQIMNRDKRSDNSSGVVGVCWDKRHGKWLVRVGEKHFGRFANLEDATKARIVAAKSIFGEFYCREQEGGE